MTKKFIDKYENIDTRERVRCYLAHYGTTVKHFADGAGVNVANFNMFLLGKRDLGGHSIAKINNYIDKQREGVTI